MWDRWILELEEMKKLTKQLGQELTISREVIVKYLREPLN